jgi:methylated-DNA-[protein]-cysteine S-methyltransferase
MTTHSIALFETALGPCGIAWGEGGITGLQLHEPGEDRTRARLRQRYPEAVEATPSPPVQAVIDGVVDLLAGGRPGFEDAPLDYSVVSDFQRRVYEIALKIPAGRTVTYGDIARELGNVAFSREVGQALGKNPYAPVVPCHRVLAAGGKAGGFSARGGLDSKAKLLTIEKAATTDAPSLFDDLPTVIAPRRT